jgi:hypothetical protein
LLHPDAASANATERIVQPIRPTNRDRLFTAVPPHRDKMRWDGGATHGIFRAPERIGWRIGQQQPPQLADRFTPQAAT